MWISLSFHLGHWFDSFSTVGLRNSLRANKKHEGGKKTFTCSFFSEKRESREGWVEFAWGGHDFPDWLLKGFSVSKEVETGLLFCWHESQGGVRPDYFPAVRLLHLLHRNWGCTAEFTSAVRCIKCGTVFEGCTDWLLLLYGAFNYCTDFEEGTALFIAVRSAIKVHRNWGKGYGLLVLYGLSFIGSNS